MRPHPFLLSNHVGPISLTSVIVCGFQTIVSHDPDLDTVYRAFPIVGLDHMGSGSKDPEITRLKKIDSSREGLLVKLAGGEYKDKEAKKKKPARAVIEFKCDYDRTGLEGLEKRDDRRRDVDTSTVLRTSNKNKDSSRSLQYVSFGKSDDESYVLKLDWKTRYACDNYVREHEDDESSDNHWGFFTWLIIM